MIVEELVGYVASILVAISLMMRNVVRLRVINLFGAIAFVIYGVTIQAFPVSAVNAFIVCINIYYLRQLANRKESFEIMAENRHSAFVERFLANYKEDINHIFPDFNYTQLNDPQCIFILRNFVPVGIFIYEIRDEVAVIKLDYVIKDYRDLKNATFLFSRTEDIFEGTGVKQISTRSENINHQKYLRKMQFHPDPRDPGLFSRAYSP